MHFICGRYVIISINGYLAQLNFILIIYSQTMRMLVHLNVTLWTHH